MRRRRASGSPRSRWPSTPTRGSRDLSIGQRQVVAIVKALSYASRVLIMDEPTAALTTGEVERLFGIMRRLAASGVGIVYISHRLEEVPQIADRVTVMRDGRVAGTTAADARRASWSGCSSAGRSTSSIRRGRKAAGGRSGCTWRTPASSRRGRGAGWQAPRDVSLDVHAGEIVGLAGMMGAGRTELLTALFGTGAPGRWRGHGGDRRPPGGPAARSAPRGGPASPSSPTTGAAAA